MDVYDRGAAAVGRSPEQLCERGEVESVGRESGRRCPAIKVGDKDAIPPRQDVPPARVGPIVGEEYAATAPIQ